MFSIKSYSRLEQDLDMNHYYKIKRLILANVIGASLIPLFVITGFILYQFKDSYEKKIWSNLEVIIKNHAEHIDSFLSQNISNIKLLTKFFTYGELSYQPSLEDKLFFLQSNYGPYFVDLGIVSETGVQVAYAGPYRLREANYSSSPWFKEAMGKDQYISDVFLGLRNYPHFIVTVKDDWYGHKWLLRATIDFMAFTTLVENLKIGTTGRAFILNKKGEFQTAADEEIHREIEQIVELLNTSQCEKNFCIKTTYKNKSDTKKILVAYPLKERQWLLVFTQDYSDAFSEFNYTLKFVISVSGLTVLSVLLVGFYLSQKIIKRIYQIDQEKEALTQQIIEAGKLASIGELAAGIAHEINNPVAIMVEEAGWIEDLLEEEEFSNSKNLEEFKRSLKQIRMQGKRCKDITHKLLSFARKTDPALKEINVNALINELISISTQRAKYANISIIEKLDPSIPTVMASESEIQQVFLNIINNAFDAMEKKGGELHISTGVEEGMVYIKFKDTGHGIPKANLARIFDPFFTTKPVGKGTGLGLSICYGIVKKLGGEIRVESTVGEGTAFTIILPPAQREANWKEGEDVDGKPQENV